MYHTTPAHRRRDVAASTTPAGVLSVVWRRSEVAVPSPATAAAETSRVSVSVSVRGVAVTRPGEAEGVKSTRWTVVATKKAGGGTPREATVDAGDP